MVESTLKSGRRNSNAWEYCFKGGIWRSEPVLFAPWLPWSEQMSGPAQAQSQEFKRQELNCLRWWAKTDFSFLFQVDFSQAFLHNSGEANTDSKKKKYAGKLWWAGWVEKMLLQNKNVAQVSNVATMYSQIKGIAEYWIRCAIPLKAKKSNTYKKYLSLLFQLIYISDHPITTDEERNQCLVICEAEGRHRLRTLVFNVLGSQAVIRENRHVWDRQFDLIPTGNRRVPWKLFSSWELLAHLSTRLAVHLCFNS